MILRYLVLFGGVVCMITGCNSLISQQFGTHRLRTLDVKEANSEGFGDADFVEVTGAIMGEAMIVGPALRSTDKDYVLRPILTPGQADKWEAGETVTTSLIGWSETEDPVCIKTPGCLPAPGTPIRGLLSEPTDRKNPVGEWAAQRVKLAEESVYLQLYEQPMAWYWNLALLLSGLFLAILSEAYRFQKKKRLDAAKNS